MKALASQIGSYEISHPTCSPLRRQTTTDVLNTSDDILSPGQAGIAHDDWHLSTLAVRRLGPKRSSSSTHYQDFPTSEVDSNADHVDADLIDVRGTSVEPISTKPSLLLLTRPDARLNLTIFPAPYRSQPPLSSALSSSSAVSSAKSWNTSTATTGRSSAFATTPASMSSPAVSIYPAPRRLSDPGQAPMSDESTVTPSETHNPSKRVPFTRSRSEFGRGSSLTTIAASKGLQSAGDRSVVQPPTLQNEKFWTADSRAAFLHRTASLSKSTTHTAHSPLSGAHTLEPRFLDIDSAMVGALGLRSPFSNASVEADEGFPFPLSPGPTTVSLMEDHGTAGSLCDVQHTDVEQPYSLSPAIERLRSKSSEQVPTVSKFPTFSAVLPKNHWRSATSGESVPTLKGLLPENNTDPLTPPEVPDNLYRRTSITHFLESQYTPGHGRVPSSSFSSENSSRLIPADIASALDNLGTGSPHAATNGKNAHKSGAPDNSSRKVGNDELMGSGGGCFGSMVQDLVLEVMLVLSEGIPFSGKSEETIQIVEYGALNSRSACLVAPLINALAMRHANLQGPMAGSADGPPSFLVTHADRIQADFRQLSQQLESRNDSYLSPQWQHRSQPQLINRVFSAFTARTFGAKIFPKASVYVGFSCMDLQWISSLKNHLPMSALAQGELTTWLAARASEFKPGGLLMVALIVRSGGIYSTADGNTRSQPCSPVAVRTPTTPALERITKDRSSSSPIKPPSILGVTKKKDIWDILTDILGKAIQRLVSAQLLRPAVARHLSALPIHARSPQQVLSCFRAQRHHWNVEWCTGLGEPVSPLPSSPLPSWQDETARAHSAVLPTTEPKLVFTHPAWKGVERQTVSGDSYTEYCLQLLRVFWESEMRTILRDQGNLSRGATEWTLDYIFDVAREKFDELGAQRLDLEFAIVAARRVDF